MIGMKADEWNRRRNSLPLSCFQQHSAGDQLEGAMTNHRAAELVMESTVFTAIDTSDIIITNSLTRPNSICSPSAGLFSVHATVAAESA